MRAASSGCSGVPPSSTNHCCMRWRSTGCCMAASSHCPKPGSALILRCRAPDQARADSNIIGCVIFKETIGSGGKVRKILQNRLRRRAYRRPNVQTLHRSLKWLGFLALTLYILAAVAFIALRYWVMPNIERWREPLQRELSALLEDQVELGSIRASLHWQGPRITLGDARVRDEHGRLLMRIPTLHVALAWPELLSGEARFLSLRADGVDIAFRRDTQDRVSLLGYQIEGDDEGEGEAVSDIEMLYWLSRQGDL